jgi:hypothetical protein
VKLQLPFAGIVAPEIPTELAPGTAVTVAPAQVVVGAGAAATVTFAGRLSVNAPPVRGAANRLLIRTVSVEAAPAAIDAGAKDFARVAPDVTVRFAAAAAALRSPWSSVSALARILFVTVPIVDEVTLTLNAQEPSVDPTGAGTVAPDSEKDEAPAIAVTVPGAQVVDAFGGLATVTPAGKLSVKAAFVSAPALPLVIVTVNVEVVPVGIDAGAKALATAAPVCTIRFPEIAAAFDTPWSVVIEPTGRVLVNVPFVVAVTFAVTVQKLLAGIVPPENVSDPAPATAVIEAPAHVDDAAGGLARVIAAGKLSVKEAPVKLTAFALLSLIVSVETPPPGIGEGENDFVPVGPATAVTERVALAGVPLLSPSFVTSAPAGIVLMWLPATVDVTST